MKHSEPLLRQEQTHTRTDGRATAPRGRFVIKSFSAASRYGKPDLPFVIAALCLRDLATVRLIEWALYGPMGVKVPIREGVGQMDEAFVDRNPRGLWQRGAEPQVTRVSAILTALHLNPWLIANSDLTLWRNPWAAKPLTDDLPFRVVSGDLDQNRLVVVEPTRRPLEILGLPTSWPGPANETTDWAAAGL